MCGMTYACWWAFTYTREGFIPQMYGSIRVCSAATTSLNEFGEGGVMWGDLPSTGPFRHAGFSSDDVGEIEPAELYAGQEGDEKVAKRSEVSPLVSGWKEKSD